MDERTQSAEKGGVAENIPWFTDTNPKTAPDRCENPPETALKFVLTFILGDVYRAFGRRFFVAPAEL